MTKALDTDSATGLRVRWWQPEIGVAEYERVRDVLESGYVNDGAVTREFERAIAERLGCAHAIAVTSGTTALYVALTALGIGPGDEVIVPNITFIATANAVTMTGARAVLVDVDAQSLTMSPESFERAITLRTKAVVPVHLSGRAGTLGAVLEIAKYHSVSVVEDAAEALGSSWRGKSLGTYGVAGCLSFSPNKLITTGQGGMILTSSAALARRAREIKDQGRPEQGTGGDDIHPALGFNFKFTNVQAAIGLAQLDQLNKRLARQVRTYEQYRQAFANDKNVVVMSADTGGGERPMWSDALVRDRDQLVVHLGRAGFECRKFWYPLHTQKPYRQSNDAFAVSTLVWPSALWLPAPFTVDDEDVLRIINAIRAYYRDIA